MEAATLTTRRILESSPVHEDEAGEYSELIRAYAWLLNRPMIHLISQARLRRARVLDIGTGPGWIPVEIALRHPQWEIWAIDPSGKMLQLGRQAADHAGVSDRIHFQKGDATSLQFDTGIFDLVYSNYVVHHLPEPKLMFDETARVTRGGGRILIKDLLRQVSWRAALCVWFSRFALRYSPCQLKMYSESLRASLTLAEVRNTLDESKLQMAEVRQVGLFEYVIAK